MTTLGPVPATTLAAATASTVPSGGPWVILQVNVLGVVFGLLAALPGVVVALLGVSEIASGVRLHDTDTDSVADAVDGEAVALEGEARPTDRGGTVEAPLSGRDCLAYDYTVEKYVHRGEHGRWETVDDGEGGVPFLLSCADGEVLVEADRDPSFDVDDDELRATVDSDEEPPPAVAEYLAREETPGDTNPVAEVGPLSVGGQKRRYTEHRLVPGETTFVAGVARSPATAERPVPRTANAAVGPAESGDPMGESSLPVDWFTVSDASKDEYGGRLLRDGVLFVVGGAVWMGLALGIVVSGIL